MGVAKQDDVINILRTSPIHGPTMSFTNVYYKRTTGTPKQCYVCYKPTTTCLATANTVDFIYTCDSHLSDPGFASQLGDSSDPVSPSGVKKAGLSAEEIAKIKEEYELKQQLKKEKSKSQAKDDSDASKDRDKQDKDKDKEKEKEKKPASPSPVPTPPTPSTPKPTHQRYSLHRDFFAMRLAEHRKRRQTKQAQELAPRLPGAPRGPIG